MVQPLSLPVPPSQFADLAYRANFAPNPQNQWTLKTSQNKSYSYTADTLRELIKMAKEALKNPPQQRWFSQAKEEVVGSSSKKEDPLIKLEQAEMALNVASRENIDNLGNFAEHKETLSNILKKYKKNPDLYPGGSGTISESDTAQIETVCRKYPELYELLVKKNKQEGLDPYITSFVKFCLRASLSVEIFVKFPAEVEFIHSHYLTNRLSLNKELLTIQDTHLCLMVDGNPVAIEGQENKKKLVTLKNLVNSNSPPYQVSLKEIFAAFKEKRTGYGNFEIFPRNGVSNWNSILLGSYNPQTKTLDKIDPQKDPHWFEKLPKYECVSRTELGKRYPGFTMPMDYAFVFCSNQQQPNLNVLDTHAFIELVWKDPESSQFFISPIGFQPTNLPQTSWEKAKMLKNTNPANVHFPDEGRVLLNRKIDRFPFALSAEEFKDATAAIGHTIGKSLLGNVYFQFTNKNCAYAVMKWFYKSVGKKFYDSLKNLWGQHMPEMEEQRYDELVKRIQRNLDEVSKRQLVDTLVDRLIDTHEVAGILTLSQACLDLFSRFLRQGEAPLPSLEEADIRTAIQIPQESDKLKSSLKTLLAAAIDIQHVYKTSLFETKIDTPLFSQILSFFSLKISWGPLKKIWEVVRVWGMRFVYTLLGAHRTYKIKDKQGKEAYRSVAQGGLCWNCIFNLPAKFGTVWDKQIRTPLLNTSRATFISLKGRIVVDDPSAVI